MTAPPAAVLHGYTLADLDRLARAACTADRSLAADMSTRFDIAWSAIALALAEATEPPSRQDLVRVGWQAIYAEVREVRRLYGIPRDEPDTGVASASRFAVYWRHTGDERAEERLVEGLAARQIVQAPSGPYRDAVKALAATDDYRAAAEALGITYAALQGRINTARRRARVWWFAPDTAPPVRGTDRRVGAYGRPEPTHCPAGHEWTPETTLWRNRKRAGGTLARLRRCAVCERQRDRARHAARKAVA